MGGFIVGCCLAVSVLLIITLGKKLANKRKKKDDIDTPVCLTADDNNKFEEKE